MLQPGRAPKKAKQTFPDHELEDEKNSQVVSWEITDPSSRTDQLSTGRKFSGRMREVCARGRGEVVFSGRVRGQLRQDVITGRDLEHTRDQSYPTDAGRARHALSVLQASLLPWDRQLKAIRATGQTCILFLYPLMYIFCCF